MVEGVAQENMFVDTKRPEPPKSSFTFGKRPPGCSVAGNTTYFKQSSCISHRVIAFQRWPTLSHAVSISQGLREITVRTSRAEIKNARIGPATGARVEA